MCVCVMCVMCVWKKLCACACMKVLCVCGFMLIKVCVCVMCVCVCVRSLTLHTNTNTHTHTYAYISTHKYEVGHRLEQSGTGIVLEKSTIDAKRVASVVHQLTHSERYTLLS